MMDLDDEKQFELFVRMAKTFAIKLTDEKERAIAAKWINLLETTTDNVNNIKNHAIQLLLFCLLRQCLVEPFEREPEIGATLSNYEWCKLQPRNIAEKILEKEYDKRGERDIHIELSGDLCEYVAIQEIPKFGHHFYYAFSPEAIKKWNNLDQDIIPKGLLNITVITNPDDSTLADSIRDIQKKKKEALTGDEDGKDLLNCNKSSFDRVTILDRTGSIHKGFLAEQPAAKVLNEREMQKLMKRGILEPQELDTDKAINEGGPEIRGPYVENVSIFKNKQKIAQNKKVKHSQQENLECDMQSSQINEARNQMLDKVPPRIRERLLRKYIKETEKDEDDICAPDIFEDEVKCKQRKGTVTGVKGVKIRGQRLIEPEQKKWKIEAFGLSPSEKFHPAHKVIDDLIKEQEMQEEQEVDEVQESFERSWQKYQEEKQKPFGPEPLSCRRAALLNRLQCLKNRQHKKIVFDDVDVSIEPEEREFEKFVYREYPDDPADVTILDNMPTDDMFGPDQIADIQAMPQPKALHELDKAGVLLEAEMITDDIFGEDQIQHPKLAFKEVAIEGSRDYGCTSGSYRVGKRIVAIPGEVPISQTYVEQSGNEALFDDTLLGDYTPPITDSMINNIADKKLTKLLGGPRQAPRIYGPWAADFKAYIERMEKGEDESKKPDDDEAINESILHESEMDTDDMFREIGEPSPIFQKEKARRQTQKLETIKKHMAERRPTQRLRDPNQDFLEPYVHERFYDPPGLLDTSLQEQQQQTPLIKKIHVQPRADPFASFERQMDESLEYFKDEPFSEDCSKPNVFLDSQFLNRRIQNEQIPADNSILDSDEMTDYFQQSQIEEPQKRVKILAPSRTPPRTPQPIFSHLYISKKNSTPCEMSEILPQAYMEQEISGFEDFLVAPEEDLEESIQILEPDQMQIADMFGQDAILSPSKAQYQSPARVALIKSIAQTKRFQNLAKKFRTKKGLPHQASPQYNYPKLQKFIEYEEQMFDKASPMKYSQSINPALLDKSYNRSGLPSPLINSPKPAAPIDPFISFEERLNEALKPEERSFGHSFINEGELSGMFEEDMIGEPLSFQNLGISEYPQVNKFLLSGIGEERIQDVSCLDISSSESQDETMWPEDLQKKYEYLLKFTQNRPPPETAYISNPELSDRCKDAEGQCNEEDILQRRIANAEEQTKKLNILRQKVQAFKDRRSENQVSDVTFLYKASNKPGCYKKSTPRNSCRAPSPCRNKTSEQNNLADQRSCDYLIQSSTDNFIENENMPQYESPVQPKGHNISFYASQMESRHIQEEEMPSFSSSLSVDQNLVNENLDTNSYVYSDKVYPTTSLNYSQFSDNNSNQSLISTPISVDFQTKKLNEIKHRFAAWKDLQKGSVNNISLKEAYPYLMKNSPNEEFFKSDTSSPSKRRLEYNHARKVYSNKTSEQTPIPKPERRNHVCPRRTEPQENLEAEQMPFYQSPPKARPIRLSAVRNISGDIFEEKMPEYNTPPKLQSIRTISGEFKEKDEPPASLDRSSSPKYNLTQPLHIKYYSHNASKSLKTSVSKHDSSGVYETPYKPLTPKMNQIPKSPLVRKPVQFSPITWGSFDKGPEFNISPSQLMDKPINKISPPRFIDLPNSPQYVSTSKRVQLPRKTGFSPIQFAQRIIDNEGNNIDDEEFPSANLSSEEHRLGDLAYAHYILKSKNNLRETPQQNKRPTSNTMPSVQSTSPISSQISKCELQKEFEWVGDLVPYEKQIHRTPTKSKAKVSRISPRVSQIKFLNSRAHAQQTNKADYPQSTNPKILTVPRQLRNEVSQSERSKRQSCRQQCQKPAKSKSNMCPKPNQCK